MSLTIAAVGLRSPNDPETFARLVSLAYDWLLDEQPDTVITDLQLGFGQAVATAALEHGIPVVAYIAHMGQGDRWSKADNERYQSLIRRCKINLIRPSVPANDAVAAELVARCHEAMVDNCNLVLALWDGSDGGTANCVRYAEDKFIDVQNIWDRWKP